MDGVSDKIMCRRYGIRMDEAQMEWGRRIDRLTKELNV